MRVQGKMWKQPDTPNKCRMETAAAVQCYKANSQNPLECRKMVPLLFAMCSLVVLAPLLVEWLNNRML